MSGWIVAAWFLLGIVATQIALAQDKAHGREIDSSYAWIAIIGPVSLVAAIISVISDYDSRPAK